MTNFDMLGEGGQRCNFASDVLLSDPYIMHTALIKTTFRNILNS